MGFWTKPNPLASRAKVAAATEVERSALKIHGLTQSHYPTELSSRPEYAVADGVEGSAVAFSWFRVEYRSMLYCGCL